jgi:hypothetical protein
MSSETLDDFARAAAGLRVAGFFFAFTMVPPK